MHVDLGMCIWGNHPQILSVRSLRNFHFFFCLRFPSSERALCLNSQPLSQKFVCMWIHSLKDCLATLLIKIRRKVFILTQPFEVEGFNLIFKFFILFISYHRLSRCLLYGLDIFKAVDRWEAAEELEDNRNHYGMCSLGSCGGTQVMCA